LLDATLQAITLASVAPPSASAAAGSSADATVSGDGRYVAYESTAPNLVAGQSGGAITRNVFLFDRQTGTATLVSHDDANPTAGGNADSFSAVLSGNGRFLYYLSRATDLVSGGTGPATENLYVYDTAAGTNRLVTANFAAPGRRADQDTGLIDPTRATGAPFAVSSDGTRVAYVSTADDLVSGLTGSVGAGHANVFLATVSANSITTQLVSHQAGSTTAGAGGWSPALSADGGTVAFVSDGTDLVSGQVEQAQPPGTATYTAVFLSSAGSPANLLLVSRQFGTTATVASATSDTPVINQDGSVVAFRSDSADLVAQQFPGSPPGNVFVYERAIDTVGLVSHVPGEMTVGEGGTPFTPDSQGAIPLAISGDGRSIAYQSQAAGLGGAAPQAGNPPPSNVFLWQLSAVSPGFSVDGTNSLVSGAGGSAATPANGSSFAPALSADGGTVAFVSAATNLVSGQATTGSAQNVFTASTAAVAGGEGVPPVLVSSADGSPRVAANADSAGGAAPLASNPDLYLASIGLSGDGGVLTFQSAATNLSTDVYKANNGTDVFAFDRNAGLALVSRSTAPVVTAGGDSYVASVSADDRYTAFVSDAFDLVAGQQNNHFGLNVFLRHDLTDTTATITLVNHVPPPGALTATGDSGIPQPPFMADPAKGHPVPSPPDRSLMPAVSGDGSAVVFVTNDHDLVPGQVSPGSFNNVFRYNVADGSVTLVSHLPGQPTASGAYDSNSPAVSFNGEFVAFISNGGVYLSDASAPQALMQIAASGSSPSISDDGRYVAYISQGNAFLYDRQAGTSTLISHAASSTRGDLLALTAPPATVTAGPAFALTATVQDAFGKTDTTFNGTVALALGAGSPAGAVLGGSGTAPAFNGVAHFNDVLLTLAGTGYALTASATGVTPATTAAFSVVPAAASQLVFVTPPSLSLLNQPLSPTVAVAIEDTYGNVVNSSASVTVAVGSQPGGLALSGTKTVTSGNGVATFNGLIVAPVVAGQFLPPPYTLTLTAHASGLPDVTSPSFVETNVSAASVITTVAGNGTLGFSGDGGPATAAELHAPVGVAVDAAGDLYIADYNNQRVRKVSPSGTITTVAGGGNSGLGDGGPATAAALARPSGVGVDVAGDLYIADTFNNRVREVSPSGTITTVAGNGTAGFSGDGGPATAAELDGPSGVAVDAAGDVYIADTVNGRVRQVSPSGTITTVAGNGTAGFSGDGGPATAAELSYPYGVAVDAAGDLYIPDASNNRIRKVSPSGTITTVAGGGSDLGNGGLATAAELANPEGVAVDAAGDLYIADYDTQRIREVTPSGTITTVAGGGNSSVYDGEPATTAELVFPSGVAVDAAGDLYIADFDIERVLQVAPTATRMDILAPPLATVSAGSSFTVTVAVEDASGNAVAGYSGPVSVVPGPNSPAAALGGTPVVRAANGIATFSLTLAQAGSGYSLLFTAPGGTGIASGNFTVVPAPAAALAFVQQPSNTVSSQAINPAVTVAVVDAFGNRVSSDGLTVTLGLAANPGGVTLGGTTTVTVAQGIATFDDLRIAQTGGYNLIARGGSLQSATSAPFTITRASAAETITTVAGNGQYDFGGDGGPATAAELYYPSWVAVDASGDLYIADTRNQRIRKVSSDGTITTVAGNGIRGFSGDGGPATAAELSDPQGVAIDAAGDLYIADNGRVREVSPSGTITTVAGGGNSGLGDGGPATAAELNAPIGLAVDAAGDLYIVDAGNQRVRKVSPSGTITTVAGGGNSGLGDGGPATASELFHPFGVAVDAAGNLYVSDAGNGRVREVLPSGTITTVAGGSTSGPGDGGPATAAELFGPTGVAVDNAGDLYIAESYKNLQNGTYISRVREVLPDGTITEFAGNGTADFGGDGGPPSAAELDNPIGLAVDAEGDLFIADRANARIRKVANPASKLAFTTTPPLPVAAGTPFTVAVSVEDANGNAVSGYAGSVALALGPGSPAGATLGGTTTASVDLDNGMAVFSGLTISQPGTGYTLTAKIGSLTAASTGPFNVGGATATLLAVTSLPSPITAGVPFTVKVAPQDAFGHTDSTYTDQVTLTLPGGTVSATPRAGVATFGNLVIDQPGKNVTLTATAPGLNSVTTAPFNVGAATATQLVDSQPTGARAGVPFAFTVTAEDGSGNVATGFNGPVTVALGQDPTGAGLNGSTRVNAVNGVARFTLSVNQGGSDYTLNAATDGLPVAATAPFNVAATPEVLAITPQAAATAGSPFGATVTAQDANGHRDPAFSGTVTLAVGPGSPPGTFLGGPTSAVAVNGTATFSGLLLTQAGSYTLTATTANLLGGFSTPFPVNAGPAAQLAVTPPPAATAGSPFTVTVAVQDSLGNTVSSFNGTVGVTPGSNPTGATLSGTTPVNAKGGIATFNLSLDRAGSGYTLSANVAGTSLAGTSTPFAVGGVTATQVGIVEPAFAVAGVPFTVTVTAQDAGHNLVPSFNGPVALALGADSPAGSALGGTLTAQAVNGVATFTGLTLATPGTGYSLAVTAGTLIGVGPHPLAVLAGGDAPSSDPVLSADGNAVAYVSAADNLVAGQAHTGFTNVLLYTVATAGNSLVSGTIAAPANGNSDTPAINLDGGFVAYRSDATHLVNGQTGPAGNVFEFDAQTGAQALVSHQAGPGNAAAGAGSSFAPAIDGDGSKVVYLSRADDLVPGEVPGSTVNVYLYAGPLGESFLVTGQLGSATVPGNGDAFNALISRHSFPLLSSAATDLVRGVGAHSNGYRNTLISTSLSLQNDILPSGTGAGALVGTFGTSSAFAGQFRPPTYSLTGAGPDDGDFQIPAGGRSLVTAAAIDRPALATYTIQVRTDVGLGPIVGLDTLVIPVGVHVTGPITSVTSQQPPPPPPLGSLDITAETAVTPGRARRSGGRYRRVLTLRYRGGAALEGMVSVVLVGLGRNARLANRAGQTASGAPYVSVPAAALVQGVGVPLLLDFRTPGGKPPHYTLMLLAEAAAG
jgi:sugar lactone lactonase YvrE/Tol biopolymer transport system component